MNDHARTTNVQTCRLSGPAKPLETGREFRTHGVCHKQMFYHLK